MAALAVIALIACVTGGACSRSQYTKVTRTDGSTVIGTLVTMRPDVVILQTRQGQIEIRRSEVKSLDVPTISEIAEIEGAQANSGSTARNGAGTGDPAAKNGGQPPGSGDPGGGGPGGSGAGTGDPGAGGAGTSGSGSGGSAADGPGTGGSGTGGAGTSGAGTSGAGTEHPGTSGPGGAGGGRGGSGSGAPGYASGGAGTQAARDGNGKGSPGFPSGGASGSAGAAGSPGTAGAPASTSGGAADGARQTVVTIPAGTSFTVTFDAPLGSDTSRVEEDVMATLTAPIAVGTTRVVPAGAVLRGRVTEAMPAKAAGGRGRIAIRFHTLAIGARTSAIDGPTAAIVAPVFTRDDKRKVGIGAAAGAVLGGIVSRTKKAVGIGAAAGAGGAAAAVGARNELRLARGAKVRLQFTQAVPAPAQ